MRTSRNIATHTKQSLAASLAHPRAQFVVTSVPRVWRLGVLSLFGRLLPSAVAKPMLVQLGAMDLERLSVYFGQLSKADRMASVEALEGLFFELVSKFAPPVFIEAGAKDPLVSRRVRRLLGAGASVVAFEANPYTFERFTKKQDHAALGVDYRNIALATHPGEVTFNVRRREDGVPHADGQGSLLKHESYEPGHIEVSVNATTLDHVLDEFNFAEFLLWVDVEGALREVLSGATSALEHAQAIFIEVEDQQVWGGQWLAPRVQEFLLEAGLVPVARDFQSDYQHNLVFVRMDLLDSPHLISAMRNYHGAIGAVGRGRSATQRYRVARALQGFESAAVLTKLRNRSRAKATTSTRPERSGRS